MDRDQFNDLASRDFNRIPFLREISADLDTPLSIYLKVASEPNTYLFESMQGGEKWGRYSLIGLSTNNRLELWGDKLRIIKNGKLHTETSHEDPLNKVQEFKNSFKVPKL